MADPIEELKATLAELRGAAMAYRESVNAGFLAVKHALETGGDPQSLSRSWDAMRSAESRLVLALRMADVPLRPMPPAGQVPATNVLPAGHWEAPVVVHLIEEYELLLTLDGEAATTAEATDKARWQAMGMKPAEVRVSYRRDKNTTRLDTRVDVRTVGLPKYVADCEAEQDDADEWTDDGTEDFYRLHQDNPRE